MAQRWPLRKGFHLTLLNGTATVMTQGQTECVSYCELPGAFGEQEHNAESDTSPSG